MVNSQHGPFGALDSEGLPTFVEMEGFADDWSQLRLDDDDLFALQVMIMFRPQAAPVVKGTGGLRKLRFAPPGRGKGKRGAVRVCYVYLKEYGVVLLVIAYAKGEKDDLSAAEKKAIRTLIDNAKEEFAARRIK